MSRRPLHTRRATGDSDAKGAPQGEHHDGDRFKNPWVDHEELFGAGKLPAVANFMWLSCTQQARLPSKAELLRLFPVGETDWPAIQDPDPSACTGPLPEAKSDGNAP